MAYDEKLAERLRRLLAERNDVREQKMFGGIGFMVGGNMCCGVYGTDLLVRLSPEAFDAALADANTRPMEMGGRTMKGWLLVSAPAIGTARQLSRWVDRGIALASSMPAKTSPKAKMGRSSS